MGDGDAIVLWAADGDTASRYWATSPPRGMRVSFVAPRALADAIREALSGGPVIAVVGSERDARHALALGVDEVLHVRAASAGALTVAAESARLRAMGRDTRCREAAIDCDARALEVLATSLNSRLATPLAVALLNVEVLRVTMRTMIGLADAYTRKAQMKGLDDPEAVQVLAMRAAAPSSAELLDTMNDLAAALREASAAALQGYQLVVPDDLDTPCDLSAVVSEFATLVRGTIDRVVDFRVEVPGEPCRAAISRSRFVHVLSALVGNSMRGAGDREVRAAVMVRVEAQSDVAVVEVTGDCAGAPANEDTVTGLDCYDTLPSTPDARPWIALAEHARRAGGKLAMGSERRPSGSGSGSGGRSGSGGGSGSATVRLSLPLAASMQDIRRSANWPSEEPAEPPSNDVVA